MLFINYDKVNCDCNLFIFINDFGTEGCTKLLKLRITQNQDSHMHTINVVYTFREMYMYNSVAILYEISKIIQIGSVGRKFKFRDSVFEIYEYTLLKFVL